MRITLITGNLGKLDEFASLLPGVDLVAAKSDLIEIQETDIRLVAERKAHQAYVDLMVPVLVDDSCLVVDEWNGLPGALTSWFIKRVGNAGILKMASSLTSRRARVQTALGYCDGDMVHVFVGEVTGELASHELGTNGFGFDAIFIPDGHSKTFAEMSGEEKNHVSMRKLASEKFLKFLSH